MLPQVNLAAILLQENDILLQHWCSIDGPKGTALISGAVSQELQEGKSNTVPVSDSQEWQRQLGEVTASRSSAMQQTTPV